MFKWESVWNKDSVLSEPSTYSSSPSDSNMYGPEPNAFNRDSYESADKLLRTFLNTFGAKNHLDPHWRRRIQMVSTNQDHHTKESCQVWCESAVYILEEKTFLWNVRMERTDIFRRFGFGTFRTNVPTNGRTTELPYSIHEVDLGETTWDSRDWSLYPIPDHNKTLVQ